MAFDVLDIGDGGALVVIHDLRLAAAVKAFGYAWQEVPNKAATVGLLADVLTGLFGLVSEPDQLVGDRLVIQRI